MAGHAVLSIGDVIKAAHFPENIHGTDGKTVSAGRAFFIINLFNGHFNTS
jgi:hypothetical protein